MISADLCIPCKGTKNLCGLGYCPLLKKLKAQKILKNQIKDEVFGPSLSIFVGSQNYPNLSAGPMVTQEKAIDEKQMYGMDYERIVELRGNVIRGRKFQNVKEKIADDMKEVNLSVRSTDVEMKFSKKPIFNMKFSSVVQPIGATGSIKKYRIADNPKIPKKVDSILDERLKATQMIDELYSYGFDNYYLNKVMSIGSLGFEESKKIVPTRWSITATDDIIGKKLIEKIKEYPSVNEIYLFQNKFLENFFQILLIPGNWEFENFECWSPKSIWAQGSKSSKVIQDHEEYSGKKGYSNQAGGYYAARIGVLEYLARIRRQARVVCFREIGEGYVIPVGVWTVRQTVREAFKKPPERFTNLKESLNYVEQRLSVPLSEYLTKSKTLVQKRLSEYFAR